jgi:MOSC domain-containing protein YiiM
MNAILEILKIYISPGHNFFGHHGMKADVHQILSVSSVECVADKGLIGDRFYGFKENYKGQVTFFEWEVYRDLCQMLDVTDKTPEVFRRNVITRGVMLNGWIGKQFEIQGITFEGVAECSPCYWMDAAFAPGAEKALKNRGGLRARILTSGTLRTTSHD